MKKKIKITDDVSRKLELVRIKIKSGCYSPREVGYLLNDIEGQVIQQATTTQAINIDEWMDTLSCAINGDLENEKVSSIPVIKPLMRSSGFMKHRWESC